MKPHCLTESFGGAVRRALASALTVLLAGVMSLPAHAGVRERPVKRILILVSSKDGWEGEAELKFVDSDSRRLANVLMTIGRFDENDVHFIQDEDAKKKVIIDKLKSVGKNLKEKQEDVMLVFYYSGHADESALHTKEEGGLAYKDLRKELEAFPAKMKLGIIDACSSGAMMSKGGASDLLLEGMVLLTSSRRTTRSFMDEKLGGSIFTHYLDLGLRGAADANGDNVVDLKEAFVFAQRETVLFTDKKEKQDPQFQLEMKNKRRQVEFSLMGNKSIPLTWMSEATSKGRILQPPAGLPQHYNSCHVTLKRKNGMPGITLPWNRSKGFWLGLMPGENPDEDSWNCEERMSSKGGDRLPTKEGSSPGQWLQEQKCFFDIAAHHLFVDKDQRTNRSNLEGLLELRARFSAANATSSVYPSLSSVVAGAQGEAIWVDHFIGRTAVDSKASIPIGVEMWEVEYGFQGGDDYGRQQGFMALDCARDRLEADLRVPLSADTELETPGSVLVRFTATRYDQEPALSHATRWSMLK